MRRPRRSSTNRVRLARKYPLFYYVRETCRWLQNRQSDPRLQDHGSPELSAPVKHVFVWLEAMLEEVFREGTRNGEYLTELNPKEAAGMMVLLLLQGGYVTSKALRQDDPFYLSAKCTLGPAQENAVIVYRGYIGAISQETFIPRLIAFPRPAWACTPRRYRVSFFSRRQPASAARSAL